MDRIADAAELFVWLALGLTGYALAFLFDRPLHALQRYLEKRNHG